MKNTDEMVKISYDFQSGSYIQSVKENPKFNKKYTEAIAKVINSLDTDFNSILEAGVGEATTLANLIPKLKDYPEKIFGFDLSWSRARYARSYCENNHIKNAEIFVGNIFNIPLADDSIEIVYTSHSIEPNGGREEEALLELMRITKKYLILLEPDYELASSEAKKRMEKHGYIKKLYSTALSLGFNIIEHKLFDIYSNPLNPTGLLIIKKDSDENKNLQSPFSCPVTGELLKKKKNTYYAENGLLVYPIIDGVPCLLKENSIIATKFMDDFDSI
jgi:ubiquinone/menaquinone biosynthesis C-methylase UbiE